MSQLSEKFAKLGVTSRLLDKRCDRRSRMSICVVTSSRGGRSISHTETSMRFRRSRVRWTHSLRVITSVVRRRIPSIAAGATHARTSLRNSRDSRVR